jgi:DNA primase
VIDTKAILETADLIRLLEIDLGPSMRRSGRYQFWHCPFHAGDKNPSFAVTEDNGRYHCFGCGKSGDAITWMREYKHLSFVEACSQLERGHSGIFANQSQRKNHPEQLKTMPDSLQATWKAVIKVCEKNLWSDIGKRARKYLNGRGLNDDTLHNPFFRIGYSPGIKINNIWIERGIVLPCFTVKSDLKIDFIHYIKIRRPSNKPKYKKLAGGGCSLSGLYGAQNLLGPDIIFFTEGEFDTLLLHQEAGDLLGVATLGGAPEKYKFGRFGKFIGAAKTIIVAYDMDPAGKKGQEYWQGLSERVKVIRIPTGNDITDYWISGGNLREWIFNILEESDAYKDEGIVKNCSTKVK